MSKSLTELIESFQNEKNVHNFEGKRGLTFLCMLSRALGYRDSLYFGQLTKDAIIGDFLEFLEDNPGVIESIVEWIGNTEIEEWKDSIKMELHQEEIEEE